jgi:hypothetical protein
MQDQTTADRALEERAVLVSQLRALADYLERTTDAPVPLMPSMGTHRDDVGEAHRLAALLGLEPDTMRSGSGYAVWCRRFGPIRYTLQTQQPVIDSRLLEAVERTLGRPLTTEDRARALGHLDTLDQPLVPDDAADDAPNVNRGPFGVTG